MPAKPAACRPCSRRFSNDEFCLRDCGRSCSSAAGTAAVAWGGNCQQHQHGVALLAALIASPFLVVGAVRHGDVLDIIGVCVFAATMVVLYGTSMLYHALPSMRAARAKQLFQVLDHSAIYLLIAGTYTPFTLGVLRGPWGWSLFGLVWVMALAGIAAKAFAGIRWPRLSTVLYLAMAGSP